MYHHTRQTRNVHLEEWRRNNQRDHKQEYMNMGSAPGGTTIRKCGKQHSGTNFKTITSPVFTCSTFQPNYSKSPQGNQTRFPEDVAGPHRKTHQETPLEIKEYNNGKPAYEKTRVTINQIEIS